MSDVFRATFSDFRLVKGRKVAQIVLETPLEEADKALGVLGGVPRPDQERWVAVARLNTTPAPEKPTGKTPSQRAWALCQSPKFGMAIGETQWSNPEAVAATLRHRLDITSRGQLDTDPEARARFESLEREYQEASR